MGTARLRVVPFRLPAAPPEPSRAPVWTLGDLSGRLVELSASTSTAHLTAAFGLVLEAQLAGDRAAWVAAGSDIFYPPDVADAGIDLAALPVILAPDAHTAGRAADHLARSGGFGLIVIDLSAARRPSVPHDACFNAARRPPVPHDERQRRTTRFPIPLLSRLFALARQHDAAIVLLTRKPADAPSLHSIVALRAEAQRRWSDGRYDVCIRVIKDKRSGAGWTHVEACHGPAGLR